MPAEDSFGREVRQAQLDEVDFGQINRFNLDAWMERVRLAEHAGQAAKAWAGQGSTPTYNLDRLLLLLWCPVSGWAGFLHCPPVPHAGQAGVR